MKTSSFLLALSVMLLPSCSLKNLKPDPEMTKAMEEVVRRYQGKLNYSFGVSASSSTGKSKYIELTIAESPLLNSLDDEFRQVAAGGIAYTLYKPLAKNLTYTDINIIIDKAGVEHEFSIPVKELKRIDSLLPIFESTMNLYDSGEFEKLSNTIYQGEAPSKQQEFVEFLKQKQNENGAVTKKSPLFGFAAKERAGTPFLSVCYRLNREKNSQWVELLMDLSNPKPIVGGLQHLQ